MERQRTQWTPFRGLEFLGMLAAAMPDAELPHWLDQVDVDTIAVFTLDDGERLTADVLEFDEDRSELIVDVVSSNRSGPQSGQRRHAIPVSRVISFEARSRAEQPWPFSDPCRGASFSLARFFLLSTLFLSLMLGGVPLFFLLTKRPYGLQEASAIVYTLFAVFFTFGATKGFCPYMFTCPAVETQVPRLLCCHLGFLVALFVLQTAALRARPNLPDWWNTNRGGTLFDIALLFLCAGLGYAQVFTNRSLLDCAHREFNV
jgi:hypothetical protein